MSKRPRQRASGTKQSATGKPTASTSVATAAAVLAASPDAILYLPDDAVDGLPKDGPKDSPEPAAIEVVEVAVEASAAGVEAEAVVYHGDVVPVPKDRPAKVAEVLAASPDAILYLPDETPDPAPPTRYLARAGHDPTIGADDLYLFAEGTHTRLFDKLGAQPLAAGGVQFAVWAPNARHVSVIGEWNGWDPFRNPLARGGGGLWVGRVAAAAAGMLYKYRVIGMRGEVLDKADPCAQASELPALTASRIVDVEYAWRDEAWMQQRAARQGLQAPISVYELHLGSWQRGPDGAWLSYRELAPRLVAHVRALGFTHVEFMPLTEHPFYGSWGYQTIGYYAPSARFGGPQDLMFLIDELHRADIGVILDWVPGHFPGDAHGLARFDGTYLYEHRDPQRRVHPEWQTMIFNHGRHEVRSFLVSSAAMWIERYHVDGIRVDAVASMLYLSYARRPGEWQPNKFGGPENLDTVLFVRALNAAIHGLYPGVLTIAEESTSWPMVTGPVDRGGLGFDLKWDMGWMHDSLRYLARDPLARKHHHNELNFRMWYAYNERYMLPLSHDEVVHGKGSLIRKMHGDSPAKFASLRLLLAYMFTTPGRKLLFMGDEFAQVREWSHERALDWGLREAPEHAGVEAWLCRVAQLYRADPALHELDHDPAGFEWMVVDDNQRSLAVYMRLPSRGPVLLVAINFTPVTWSEHRIGVPAEGRWTLVDRSDAAAYGGDEAVVVGEQIEAEPEPAHDRPFSLQVTLPPLTCLIFRGPEATQLRASARAHRAARIARETAIAAEELAREAAAAAVMAVKAREAAEEAARVARLAATQVDRGDA